MITRQTLLLLAAAPLTALVVAACANTLNAGGSSGNVPEDSGSVVVVDAAPDVSSSGGPDATADATPDAPVVDSGANCTFVNLSGSSSTGGMCQTTEEYSCNGGTKTIEITCDCPANTCKCGALALTGSCGVSCGPTASIRAQCGVDSEPPGGDAGGSSSSSSGK